MSVNNMGGDSSPLFLAEQAVLDGTPARDAFQLHYKCYRTFQAHHPHDYHRLKHLAKCVRAVDKGCTIRAAAKLAGYTEAYFKKLYPQLADRCRDSRVYREKARIAAICEHLVCDPEASIAQVARRIGETVNMVSKAHRLYYGY